jgi:hypothetical protein
MCLLGAERHPYKIVLVGVKLHLKFAGWGVNKEKECMGGGGGHFCILIGKSRLVVFYRHS